MQLDMWKVQVQEVFVLLEIAVAIEEVSPSDHSLEQRPYL